MDGGVLKSHGQKWNKGCNTCICNNGKVTCELRACDCIAIKNTTYLENTSNTAEDEIDMQCCSTCFETEQVNTTCTNSDVGGREHFTGDKWFHNCQQCECKVSCELQ